MKNELCEEFINNYLNKGTYANREEIENIVYPTIDLIKKNQDKSVDEIIKVIIDEDIKLVDDILNNYTTPGATVGISAGDIDVKIFGGNINSKGDAMRSDAIFDIASMSKLFTQIAIYSLISEDVFSFDDKIVDLNPKFVNLGDLTVRDITTFTTSFKTPGRISDQDTVEKALHCLYNAEVTGKGQYNYNDIGMIIMKEVMEEVTGVSYKDLIDKYVLKKLNLKDTYVGQIPEEERYRFTGSPNQTLGLVNDGNTTALGGVSGAAGISASADDIKTLERNIFNKEIFDETMVNDFSTAGIKNNRGVAGNTYVMTKEGLANTCVDYISNYSSFAIQGSTRVNAVFGRDSSSAQLFNPSSISIEEAKEIEARINADKAKEGKAPISIVKEYTTTENGIIVPRTVIDSRNILPLGVVDKTIKANAKSSIQLEFVDFVFKKLYNYQDGANVDVQVEGRSR